MCVSLLAGKVLRAVTFAPAHVMLIKTACSLSERERERVGGVRECVLDFMTTFGVVH